MGYKKHVIRGFSWGGGLRITTRAITFVRTVILARLLTPNQFGIFGIALLVISFVEILTETGINVLLVQEDEKIDKYINTAWIVSIFRGIVIALIVIFTAPVISSFFNSPDSLLLLFLISLVPLIKGFMNPSVIKFQKDLLFNKEFYFRSSIFLFDSSITITLAFITREVSSLVWGLIAGAFFEVILSFFIVRPRPIISFDKQLLKNILSRGKWVTASGLFNYLFHNADNVVVGKILGTPSLGLYQMAYRISIIPISEVTEVVSKVTFPVFVKISGDSKRLKMAFFKTSIGVTAFIIPIGIVFFAFPKQIIELILGPNWVEAVPVFRVLVIFGVIRGISGYAAALFLAVKKQEYVMIVTFVSMLGLLVSIIPLVIKYGIVGAGISAIIGSVISLPFFAYYVIKIFKRQN